MNIESDKYTYVASKVTLRILRHPKEFAEEYSDFWLCGVKQTSEVTYHEFENVIHLNGVDSKLLLPFF